MILAYFLAFLGMILVLGGVGAALFAWFSYHSAESMSKPLSHIGRLRPGHRRVRGKIAPFQGVLRSPLTNQECVYYQLRVYEERTTWSSSGPLNGGLAAAAGLMAGGVVGAGIAFNAIHKISTGDYDERSIRSWHHLLDEMESVSFLIEDETGLVEVDPLGATIKSKTKARMATNMLHPVLTLSRIFDKLRDEHDIHAVDERGNYKTLHFVEEALFVGDQVTVLGAVSPLEDGQLCFQSEGEPLLLTQGNTKNATRAVRDRAKGFAIGAGVALALGLVCWLGVLALILHALVAR